VAFAAAILEANAALFLGTVAEACVSDLQEEDGGEIFSIFSPPLKFVGTFLLLFPGNFAQADSN
jgi:hypothetical protein